MMRSNKAIDPHRVDSILRSATAWGLFVCALAAPQPALAQRPSGPQSATVESLRTQFLTPPASARLRCYWWWLNGHTDRPTITHDLEEMKAKGFGGALLVDANGADQEGNNPVPAGPRFGSPAWVDLYTHALREADRLGLEITLNITSGWNLGGPDVTPEQASKVLTWTRTPVHGGSRAHIQLAAPAEKNGFYRQITVLAYPLHGGTALHALPGMAERSAARETGFSMPPSDWMLSPEGRPGGGSGLSRPTANDVQHLHGGDSSEAATAAGMPDTTLSEVKDLSAQVSSDGTLTWDTPPGDWEVLRIGYTDSDARVSTSSDTWKGRALDYMSREAFDAYWDRTVQPLLDAAKPFHSLKYLATDSWELGGTNWTETFASEFRRRRGYDPLPWLPAVAGRIVDSPDATTRFLTDLRRTVADLIAVNHYQRFAERAAQNGLGVQAESGGPHGAPIDALQTFSASAVPQAEFWSQNPHRDTDVQRFFVKEAASAANIYGKRFAAAEGETSIQVQWSESLATDLKPSFDMAATEGLNRLVWHEFTSSPAATGLPGQEYFAGTHLNPKVTWWNPGNAFFAYLDRVQFMMQQGTPVNDLLYFYGDNVPAFVRFKADDPARVLPGYDYDVVDEDALLKRLTLEPGGMLVSSPTGMRWHTLMLPQSGRVSYDVLLRAEQFLQAGGSLIGMPPTSPPGAESREQQDRFDQIVRRVWGANCTQGSQHSFGKGTVYCTRSAHEAMTAMHLHPDVEVVGSDAARADSGSTSDFDYAHRRAGALDIYFVRNGTSHVSEHDAIFRATGSGVELWDAVSGEVRALPGSALSEGRTRVHLVLPPFGSAFVVFTPTRSAAEPVSPVHAVAAPTSGWTVTFQPGRGAPLTPVVVHDLKSWTEWSDPAVRYFSGTAIYHGSVAAPNMVKGKAVYLQFSDVREIARVRVNGHDAGTVWARPLVLRVDPWLHPGTNTLEVEVTNLWPNRIIGDLQPGVTERFTHTNIKAFRADSPLLPSGLIGPMQWLIEDGQPGSGSSR